MELFGIGFLMKELQVKTTELAKFIYVDKSLISRWKAGTRNLDPKAEYFNKILELFLLKSKEVNNEVLEMLFSVRRPIEDAELKNLIKKFILNKETPSTCKRYIKDDNSYACIVPMVLYHGDEAQKNAILNFLDVSLREAPSKLTHIYDGNLYLLFEDEYFRKEYLKRVMKLLNSGFTLDLLYSTFSNTTLLLYFSTLIFHENCFIYEFNSNFFQTKISLHILENKIVLRGLNEVKPVLKNSFNKFEANNFSALFSDQLSIEAYTQIANNIKQSSMPLFTNVDENYILREVAAREYRVLSEKENKIYHTMYFFASLPSYYLMNEKLFLEVVKQSLQCENQISEIYKKYKLKRKIFLSELNNCEIIHFYSLSNLKKLSNLECVELGYENFILDVKLKLNKNQFRIFLNDIAELLENNSNYHVCLNDNIMLSSVSSGFFLCFSNTGFFAFDVATPERYRVSSNMSFVNSVTTMFEQLFLYSNKELTENLIVASMLKNI